jgi:hypothetical protein
MSSSSTSSSASELPPAGLSWGEYVERWVDDVGGWLPLADQLIHRAGDAVDVPPDPQTVERGLRRLARREHLPGGQYGRWMLRFFGVTSPVEHWLRWLGQYHSRFADLPSSLRLEQLRLWNRPPIAESSLVAWLLVGIASAHHSRLDHAACEHWLAKAERCAKAAGPAAEIEVALLRSEEDAYDLGKREAAYEMHDAIEHRLDAEKLRVEDDHPYRARLAYLRSLRFTRLGTSIPPALERARACYAAIPDSTVPFAVFRKSVGLAYCAWQAGDNVTAERLARAGAEAAGDGGLVRMRVHALNMLSRIVDGDEAARINARAHRMATTLEDEDLLRRVAQSAPSELVRI